jgi:hypothetical protein
MRTQKRPGKISIAISLVGLALGFSILGLLIVAKEHGGGALIASGILGILLGAAFLVVACLHWNFFDQTQVEEVPGTEIASESDQLATQSIASEKPQGCSSAGGNYEARLVDQMSAIAKTMQNAPPSDANPTTISVGAVGNDVHGDHKMENGITLLMTSRRV